MSYNVGDQKIKWVSKHMPILRKLHDQIKLEKPFKGLKIGVCLHMEAKTGYLANALIDGGAELAICGSNPLSTKDDVANSLKSKGVYVFSRNGMSDSEYYENIKRVADFSPNLIIDDGADLISFLHDKDGKQLKAIIGGTEETTTGIIRLKELQNTGKLVLPMIAVNDTPMKCLFDNRFGTAQSTLGVFFSATNMSISGKTMVVCGYGWCGRGIASRAKGFGASVIICEIDPVKANEAVMDGYRVMKMVDAAPLGDIFITVTGCINVINKNHFHLMKNRAILMNSGHFNTEICIQELEEMAKNKMVEKNHITTYQLHNGHEVYLLTEGRLVNLIAGEGHPIEIIDLSFSLQLLSLLHIIQKKDDLKPGLMAVPEYIDKMIAKINLEVSGVEIDELTTEQKEYLNYHE